MIVTRRRRKPFPWKRLILPFIAIALVIVAMTWPPSRNVIANGPTAPLWRVTGSTFDKIATPFHFAAQNQLLTQRNAQILALQKQVADLQAQMTAKNKQVADLNSQIQQTQAEAASSRGTSTTNSAKSLSAAAQPSTASSPSAGFAAAASGPTGGGDLSAGATPDMRRTAEYWNNMQPENAAKVVQRLPVPYVARIMALMSPDAAAAILDALPPTYVATLTQEHPELKR